MGILSDIRDILFPNVCGGCEVALSEGESQICTACQLKLPYSSTLEEKENILKVKFLGRIPLQYAVGLFEYHGHGLVKQILINVKYNHRPQLAFEMGKWLGDKIVFNTANHFTYDVLLPVPLHLKRLKARGYNQAEEIAKGIQSVTGGSIDTTSLKRTRFNVSQTKLNVLKRWQNSDQLFECTETAEELQDKHVVIVDDVVTTGATLDNLYAVLEPLRPKSISLMVLAHTK